jgi:hypothetical protein
MDFKKGNTSMNKKNKSFAPLRLVLGAAAASLLGGAVAQELRRPLNERTWHGTIAGVPYDFRPPTPGKIRATTWNKNTAQVLVPRAFGVGWTINFYPFVHPEPEGSLPDEL